MSDYISFPRQAIPYREKTKEWGKKCVLWARNKTFFTYNKIRNSVWHMKVNYDLVGNVIHLDDFELILNPNEIVSNYVPKEIQHFPIINSKLNILRGEEAKRVFDYRIVITNPNTLSDIDNQRREQYAAQAQDLIENQDIDDEEFSQSMNKLEYYYAYDWKDKREIRANALANHYYKEYNIPFIFNNGMMDALTVAEEMYQCNIEGGEPVVRKLDPMKVHVFKSGSSNKIEDADIIILEDYLSPGQILDAYYDVLSPKDVKKLETLPDSVGQGIIDGMGNLDERFGFIPVSNYNGDYGENASELLFGTTYGGAAGMSNTQLPFDLLGNVRVLQVYWKSKRKIKKVKRYDPQTGEEVFNFYPEDYQINEMLGEEEQIYYINQAWEGTLIANDIFVNIRPRVIQYNRLSNPSRCHFGIIGSIYNINMEKPVSLVDLMKPYNYLYDVIHDRLNKSIASNWGKILSLDLSMVPSDWNVDKWMYYAKVNKLAVIDSFKEGNIGAATGKLAGAMNNNRSSSIDASTGNEIQQYIGLLEFIKMEMSEVVGITKQREGQISNRETVGGVERSNLQSSHITEWIFTVHEDVKRRVMECLIETAKIALRGKSKKFLNILPDHSDKIIEIDGDEFAENDYGLVVDSSETTQELASKIETIAQAALQNSTINFSTIMKLYSTRSLAEKERLIEKNEKELADERNKMAQANSQSELDKINATKEIAQNELDMKNEMNKRDNDTKITVAQLNAMSNNNDDGIVIPDEYSQKDKDNLLEKIRQFNEKMNFERSKNNNEMKKHSDEMGLRNKQLIVENKKINATDKK